MRVSKERAADNRRRIVSAAAHLFRENGIASSGIDAIAQRAGLTHGAFYSQFESKERVTAEAIRLALERSRKWLEETARGKGKRRALADVVDAYLAPAHRDSPGDGCAIAALGAEGTPRRRDEDAIVALSCLAGALILARAVDEEAFSRRILATVAKRLKGSPRRDAA